MRRLLVALEMRRITRDRPHALSYLLGKRWLAEWEEDLILAPRMMLREGPTEVSGVTAEAECPADHWELSRAQACRWCGAAV